MAEDIDEAPRRVSDEVHFTDITGYFVALNEDRPSLVAISGTDVRFVLAFRGEVELVDFYRRHQLPYTEVYQIHDQLDFLSSLAEAPFQVQVAINPYDTENGRIRYSVIVAGDN